MKQWADYLPRSARKKECLCEAKYRHLLFTLCFFSLLALMMHWLHLHVFATGWKVFMFALCPLPSGSSRSFWTERWRWRPRSSGWEDMYKNQYKIHQWWRKTSLEFVCPVSHGMVFVFAGSPWRPRASRTIWQAWQAGEWTHWPSARSSCSLYVCVCAHMLLCGCLYLWPLFKYWEAYFQFNKQLLDMCLKACAPSNPRINGRARNLSENARIGGKRFWTWAQRVSRCRAKRLDLIAC